MLRRQTADGCDDVGLPLLLPPLGMRAPGEPSTGATFESRLRTTECHGHIENVPESGLDFTR